LIEIGSKTAEEKLCTNKQTDKQADRQTDTTKIMVIIILDSSLNNIRVLIALPEAAVFDLMVSCMYDKRR